jgi:hypothetical protein
MDPITAPSLAQLINRASRALARDGDTTLKPLGLRYAQVPVLALLREGTELTQKDLAEASGIEQPSMAQLLTRMDRDGLIRRTPHPRDARPRPAGRPGQPGRGRIHCRRDRNPEGPADSGRQQSRPDERRRHRRGGCSAFRWLIFSLDPQRPTTPPLRKEVVALTSCYTASTSAAFW